MLVHVATVMREERPPMVGNSSKSSRYLLQSYAMAMVNAKNLFLLLFLQHRAPEDQTGDGHLGSGLPLLPNSTEPTSSIICPSTNLCSKLLTISR